MNALYEIELAIHAFFLQIYFLRPNKKAKPALCDDVTLHNSSFPLIKKAKLALCDDVTLHNSSFLLIKKAKPALCDDVTLHNSSFLLIKENSHTNKFSLSV